MHRVNKPPYTWGFLFSRLPENVCDARRIDRGKWKKICTALRRIFCTNICIFPRLINFFKHWKFEIWSVRKEGDEFKNMTDIMYKNI